MWPALWSLTPLSAFQGCRRYASRAARPVESLSSRRRALCPWSAAYRVCMFRYARLVQLCFGSPLACLAGPFTLALGSEPQCRCFELLNAPMPSYQTLRVPSCGCAHALVRRADPTALCALALPPARYSSAAINAAPLDAVPLIQYPCCITSVPDLREQGQPACLDARAYQRCVMSPLPVTGHLLPRLASHHTPQAACMQSIHSSFAGRSQIIRAHFLAPVHMRYASLLHHSSHASLSGTATALAAPAHTARCTYRCWPKHRQPQVRVLTSAMKVYPSIALSDSDYSRKLHFQPGSTSGQARRAPGTQAAGPRPSRRLMRPWRARRC